MPLFNLIESTRFDSPTEEGNDPFWPLTSAVLSEYSLISKSQHIRLRSATAQTTLELFKVR